MTILNLSPGEIPNQDNRQHVQECSKQMHQLLMEYCHNCYPNIPVSFLLVIIMIVIISLMGGSQVRQN